MKDLSISISGSGQVSDELAEKVQAVADDLRDVEGVYVTVGFSDVPPASEGVQAGG